MRAVPRRARVEPLQLVADGVGKPLREAMPIAHRVRAQPGVTSIVWSGKRPARGRARSLVAVTNTWQPSGMRARSADLRLIVELAEDVVEEEERRLASLVGDRAGLGEEEREQGKALLTLRSEGSEVEPGRGELELREVRTDTGRPTLEIAFETSGKSVRRDVGPAVGDTRVGQAEARGLLDEALREQARPRRLARRPALLPASRRPRPRA